MMDERRFATGFIKLCSMFGGKGITPEDSHLYQVTLNDAGITDEQFAFAVKSLMASWEEGYMPKPATIIEHARRSEPTGIYVEYKPVWEDKEAIPDKAKQAIADLHKKFKEG